MAYDERLAGRVRRLLEDRPNLTEKKMFGGLSFLLNGNMACGVLNHDLIVRVDRARYDDLMRRPNARPFDFTGRTMKGWVVVAPDGLTSDDDLDAWVQEGVKLALSLPPK